MCTCLSFSEAYLGKDAFSILQPVEEKKDKSQKESSELDSVLGPSLLCCLKRLSPKLEATLWRLSAI